jgi:transposase InsO family protein
MCWLFRRFSSVRLLRKKSDAEEAIISQARDWESFLDRKVRAIRSDGGGEFVSTEFHAFWDSSGIRREFAVPYRPQQNGRVERVNGVLIERAIALLMECYLGTILWPEAILHACCLRNRSPSLPSSTPFIFR